MDAKIIKTDAEYKVYLAEVERLATLDPPPGTREGDHLEVLAKLVEDYEKERFRFARPHPIEAIRFRMEEQGLKQKDLVPILGGKNRVSEVLSGKRLLTLTMVRALSQQLRIPADLLIQEKAEPRSRTPAAARKGTAHGLEVLKVLRGVRAEPGVGMRHKKSKTL
jgi:HTH-type transcriptional regulator/antitoxin HigA